jgi:DNA-binding transcriptional LysR family regulator
MAGRESIPLEELLEEEFLLTEFEGVCSGRLRELAARRGAVLRTSIEVDSAYAVTELVKQGMGTVAFLPECYAAEHLAAGRLAALPVEVEPQTYYSQIFTHRSRWVPPFAEEFIKAVKNHRPEG